ncbi:Uncharacterised protein [Mycobacterium tuberculosis]|nr:Uncharacterised protein [Mycobacterium tuberculosis]
MTPGGSNRFHQESFVTPPDNTVRFLQAIAAIAAR